MDKRLQVSEGMTCAICGHGRLREGTATVTLDRNGITVVVKDVPALICDNCSEEYVRQPESSRLLAVASDAAASGVEFDVRRYTVRV